MALKLTAIPLRLGVANGFKGITSTFIKLVGYPSWNRQIEATILFRKMDLKNESLALEVGCGTAPVTAELTFRGISMVGVDINRFTIEVAHRRYGKIADLMIADASRLPFRQTIFNFILSLSAMEHFWDIDGFLSDSHKCLRSRGALLIITDGKPIPASNIWKKFPKFLLKKRTREMMKAGLTLNEILLINHQHKYQVIRYYDCKDISKLESAGFRIKECEQFMGGKWACLFQAYLLVNGLNFTNTIHRLISILLNPFVYFVETCSRGVGVYIKCIKE